MIVFPEHIKQHKIEVHSPEWHKFRENGIGSSEVGVIQGLNPYETLMGLYHRKVGDHDQKDIENYLMFWGTQHEPAVLNVWQYYDGTQDGFIKNFNNKQIIRNAYSPKTYFVNDKYPWLFVSPDGLSNEGVNMITGEPIDKGMNVECKTISHWASRVWEGGIPPYHIAQVQMQMLVLELDYTELAVLKDGNQFEVYPIEARPEYQQGLVEITKDFWYNKVIPAKEAYAKLGKLMDSEEHLWPQYQGIIDKLEPPPDGSEAYKEYQSQHFKQERDMIQGATKYFATAQKQLFLKALIKRLKYLNQAYINILGDSHVKANAEHLSYDSEGHTRYWRRANAINYQLDNKVKPHFLPEDVDIEVEKLNLKRSWLR